MSVVRSLFALLSVGIGYISILLYCFTGMPPMMINVILAIYYTVMVMIITSIGLFIKDRLVRGVGLLLMIPMLFNLFRILAGIPDSMLRVLVFITVGLLLTGMSFLYQKISRQLSKS